MLKKSLFAAIATVLFAACQSEEEIKRDQYFVEGMALYNVHCANCHQTDGAGLKALYPPIAKSDYLLKNKESIICSMRYGQADTIVVNGRTYHQPMPGNAQLQPMDIAEITTYIYNKWGTEKTLTATADVKRILEQCAVKNSR